MATPNQTETEAELNGERDALLAAIQAEESGSTNDTQPSADPTEGDRATSQQPKAKSGDGIEGKPKDNADTKADTKGKPEKLSRFEKAKQRESEAWKKIEAEKAEAAKAKAEVEAERSRIAEEKRQIEEAKAKPTKTPEQLEAIAKELDAEGRADIAEEARKQAQELRTKEQQGKSEQARQKVVTEWQGNLAKQVEANPALKDPNSEFHKRLDSLLKAKPVLFSYPEGINDAVMVVKAVINGEKYEATQKRVAELEAKLAEQAKLLDPGVSDPSGAPAGEKSFEAMTETEQADYLRKKMQGTM